MYRSGFDYERIDCERQDISSRLYTIVAILGEELDLIILQRRVQQSRSQG